MSEENHELGLSRGLVRLSEPTSRWAALYVEEERRLRNALSGLGPAVEHCGSTSIPGIPAKPILDILLGMPEPLNVAALRNALAPHGYEHATWAGVPGHEVFGKGDPRTHLIHAVPLHGEAWNRMIRFRDALRADPVLAAEYGALKRQLAARYADNRAAYTDAKSAFVEGVLAKG